MNWLRSTNTGPSLSITEVPHPLAPSSSSEINEGSFKPEETFTLEEPNASKLDVKEEPPTPGLYTSTVSMSMVNSSPLQSKPSVSLSASEEDGEIIFSPKGHNPLGPVVHLQLHINQNPK